MRLHPAECLKVIKGNVGVESPNPAQMKGNKPAFSYSEPKAGHRPVSTPVRLRPNTIKDQLSASFFVSI